MRTRSIKAAAGIAGASAAVLGTGVVTTQADAAVIYSGTVNLNVPATTAGLYLNLVTGATAANAAADINPWKSTNWVLNGSFLIQPDTLLVGPATPLITGAPINSTTATTVSSAATLTAGTNFYGFGFFNEADSLTHYGWIRLTVPTPITSATPSTIVDYAYESVAGLGIGAGDGVPEPTSIGMLTIGAVGLLARRQAKGN